MCGCVYSKSWAYIEFKEFTKVIYKSTLKGERGLGLAHARMWRGFSKELVTRFERG